MKEKLSPQQLREEWNYRYEERLGILTDGKTEPTPEELDIARKEADQWVIRYHQQP